MSRIISNLINKECKIYFSGLSTLAIWTIEAVDEDWVQISRQQRDKVVREIVRIDSIVKIELSE